MVLVGVDFVNHYFGVMALYGLYLKLEVSGHTVREDLASVFGADDKMIAYVEYGVTSPIVFHTYSVQEKKRVESIYGLLAVGLFSTKIGNNNQP